MRGCISLPSYNKSGYFVKRQVLRWLGCVGVGTTIVGLGWSG